MKSRIAILGFCALSTVLAGSCSKQENLVEKAASPIQKPASVGTDQRLIPAQQQQVDDPVQGVVVGPGGRGHQGARVTLFRRLRQWPRRDRIELDSVRSGPGGVFVFGVSRARGLEVEVHAQKCATLIRRVPAPKLGSLVMRLRPGFELRGRVLMPNGRPARHCAVFLEPGSGSQMRAVQTSTNHEGGYLFEFVPAENLRVSARHDQYRPATSGIVTIGRQTILKFEEGALGLSGTVESADNGTGLAGSTVLVSPRTMNGRLYAPFQTTTDSSGAFTVRGLGPGAYEVEVRHDKYSSTQQSVSLNRSRTGLTLEMHPRVQVQGRLLGVKEFEPTKLTVVSFYGEVVTTEVQPDGSFAFDDGVSRGIATLELASGPHSFKISQSRWIRRNLRETDHAIELAVEPASIIAGRVNGHDGKPLSGVEVIAALKVLEDPWNLFSDPSLLGARRRVLAVTDANGRYTIRGLEPGEVNLGFQKAQFSYFQRISEVAPPDAKSTGGESVVALSRPGTISGRVTRGGRPVSGALVTVGHGLTPVFTGPRGRYTLRDLPPREYIVRVKYRTLPLAHSANVIALTPGQDVTGVEVGLPMGRRLHGLVVDSDEIPMANVIIECPAGTETTSDESGNFVLEVPNGRTVLFLRTARFDPAFDRVPVERGARKVLVRLRQAPRANLTAKVLVLPKELPVVGLILRLDNDALAGQVRPFSVQQSFAEWARLAQRYQKLDEHHRHGFVERWIETPDGMLQLHNLPSGIFTLTLHAKGYQPFKKKVTLISGKSVDLGVIKLEPGFKVHGIVVDRGGKPIPRARIVLGRESDLTLVGARTRYLSDSWGRFAVEGVGLELHTLFVTAKGYATQSHEINLTKDILRGENDPLRVQLQTGATIKVLLVDHEGDALPFKMVQINRGFQRIGQVETDESGIAWFPNLSIGSYHVYLQAHKLRTLRNQVVRDTAGARVYELPIKQPRPRKKR